MEDDTKAIDEVLDFWFGELDGDGFATQETAKRWFTKDAEFDREIGERFGALIEAVADGEREGWLGSSRGVIAYVIVLDQLTRNVYRGTAQMYAADDRAVAAARSAIEAGLDRELPVAHRTFLYMPLMHSETREAQRHCVERFESLVDELEGGAKKRVAQNLEYAVAHQRIVDRFGRFPHRNEILGRESTEEERAFLKEPGSSF
jgi:uncharacterized protein (DUF924 family)